MSHKKQDRELREAFARLKPEEPQELPSAEELSSFRKGTGGTEDTESLLDQAASHPPTAQLLLDTREFPDLEPTVEEQAVLEAFSADEGWQALRGQLREEQLLKAVEPATEASVSASRVRWRLVELGAIAAALVVGLGLGLIWPRNISKPVVNPAVVELAAGVERTAQAKPLSVRSSPGGLELVIDVTEYGADAGSFEIRLHSEGSREEPRILTLEAAESRRYRGSVRAVWPDMPSSGAYRVEIRQGGKILSQTRLEIID